MSPVKDEYDTGESVVLTAAAADGYTFSTWSGDVSGTESSVTVTLTETFAASASFVAANDDTEEDEGNTTETPVAVSVGTIVYPESSGSVAADLELDSLMTGNVLQLTATPAAGTTFVKWDGDLQSTDNPVSITLSEDLFLIAVFDDGSTDTEIETLLSASVWPAESGVVSSDVEMSSVDINTVVQLTATPNAGYVFKSWIGDVSSTANPLNVTVSEKIQLIAEFEPTSLPVFEAVDTGDGWYESAWYGKIKTDYLPYLCHETGGWQYCVSEAEGGVFLFDHALGLMVWTSKEVYPYLFVNGDNPGWVWYFKETVAPNRWYYDFRTESLKTESELSE